MFLCTFECQHGGGFQKDIILRDPGSRRQASNGGFDIWFCLPLTDQQIRKENGKVPFSAVLGGNGSFFAFDVLAWFSASDGA